jgi:hypothetical protein
MTDRLFYYAGFRYIVGADGSMTPAPGQHPAASKDKHRMAAREIFQREGWAGSEDPEETL